MTRYTLTEARALAQRAAAITGKPLVTNSGNGVYDLSQVLTPGTGEHIILRARGIREFVKMLEAYNAGLDAIRIA